MVKGDDVVESEDLAEMFAEMFQTKISTLASNANICPNVYTEVQKFIPPMMTKVKWLGKYLDSLITKQQYQSFPVWDLLLTGLECGVGEPVL